MKCHDGVSVAQWRDGGGRCHGDKSVGVRRYGGMVFQMGGRIKLRW